MRKIEKNDASKNQNVQMLTVLGTLLNTLNAYYKYDIIIEIKKRNNGFDAGFTRDEYHCNSNKCECAHYDQVVIGNLEPLL